MTRTLTANVIAEVDKQAVAPVMFVKMDFDSGVVLLWSGSRPIVWNSLTWLGAGAIGKISPISETTSVQSEGIVLEVTGVPSEFLAVALTEPYQGRAVTIWLGFLNGETVIADPVQIFSGYMDVMGIADFGEYSTITVSAESRLSDLLKPREWRYTHEDQQIDYPGDLGLEFVAGLQEKEIVWGPS